MARVTITFEDVPEGVHVEAYQITVTGEQEEFSKAIVLAQKVGNYIQENHGVETAKTRIFKD